MGFLAAGSLGFLAAAMLPLLIHLLSRRPPHRQHFPALRLLRSAARGARRRSWWRDLLALLCRMAMLILAVLALAGLVERTATVGGGEPLVVVLDASASMRHVSGGTTAFEAGRGVAADLLRRSSGQPVALVLADGRATRSGTVVDTDASAARALVQRAEASWTGGDLAGAVGVATSMLGEGGRIVVISDRTTRSLTGVDHRALPEGVALEVVPVGAGGANQAITRIGCRPGQGTPGEPLAIDIDIVNHGPVAVDLTIELLIAGDRQRWQVALDAGARTTATRSVVIDTVGDHPLQVRIADRSGAVDVLAEDDERWAVVPVRQGLHALVAGRDAPTDQRGAVRPLLAALHAGGFTIHHVSPADESWPTAPLLLTAGIDISHVNQIRRHLDAGGAWLMFVHDEGDLALLDGSVPGLRPPCTVAGLVDLAGQGSGQLGIAGARLEHPVLAGFFGREVLLAQIEAYKVATCTPADGAASLMTLEDGGIALAERQLGRGRWLVSALSPAEAASNLAALDVLPLLITRLSGLVVPEQVDDLALPCGRRLPTADAVDHPQGQPPLVGGRVLLPWPGIYTDGDGRPHAAAIPAEEADLGLLDKELLTAVGLTRGEHGPMPSADDRPQWQWMLLLAALLMAVELLVIRPTPARRPAS